MRRLEILKVECSPHRTARFADRSRRPLDGNSAGLRVVGLQSRLPCNRTFI